MIAGYDALRVLACAAAAAITAALLLFFFWLAGAELTQRAPTTATAFFVALIGGVIAWAKTWPAVGEWREDRRELAAEVAARVHGRAIKARGLLQGAAEVLDVACAQFTVWAHAATADDKVRAHAAKLAARMEHAAKECRKGADL